MAVPRASERRYTISEIDEMRESLSRMYPVGASYKSAEREAQTEDRLRTHMQNGTDPDELKAASKDYCEKEIRRFQEWRRICEQQRVAMERAR
jgi:hypothetical protein